MNAETLKLAEQMLANHRRDLKLARESTDSVKVRHLARVQLYNAACAWGKFMEADAHDYDLAMNFSNSLETAAIFYTHHQ